MRKGDARLDPQVSLAPITPWFLLRTMPFPSPSLPSLCALKGGFRRQG